MRLLSILLSVSLSALATTAWGQSTDQPTTVEQVYPGLATGALTFAKIADLPEGLLIKTKGFEMTVSDLDESIGIYPEALQVELRKNAFFVLEQEATGDLLKILAYKDNGQSATENSQSSEDEIIQKYIMELVKDVKLEDGDIEKFYLENESMFHGSPLEAVRSSIEPYVIREKQDKVIDEHVKSIGKQLDISVSANWTKAQLQISRDNIIDKARLANRPALVIFSAASCCGPDTMLPVRAALQETYNDKVNIVYIDPSKEQILSSRYGVRSVPTQIIFDKNGKETFRHSGYYSADDMSVQLATLVKE